MATENIVTGKFYRILKNASSKTWDRISFWTHADDVSLSNGTTLSSDLNTKQTKINATQTDFAQVENSSTSAHAYTKGQMLIYNNQLYRVKAAIAVGNTLSTSTNIEVASVSTLSSMLTANNGNQFYFDVKNGQYGFYPTASKTSSQFVPFGGTSLPARYYGGFQWGQATAYATGTYTLNTDFSYTPFLLGVILLETSSASTLSVTLSSTGSVPSWNQRLVGFKNGVASSLIERNTASSTYDVSNYDVVLLSTANNNYVAFTTTMKLT